MKKNPMNTVIYTRVSTDDQADGTSHHAQRELCHTYLKLHNLPAATQLTCDTASGKDLNRPGIKELIQQAEQGQLERIIVLKLDRLTRNIKDLCHLLELFEKHNVELHGVQDRLDTSSASGRLIMHIMASVAQWERATIAERTSTALTHIKNQGYLIGRAPYGWSPVEEWDGPGMLITPNEDYTYVLSARAMRKQGQTLANIGYACANNRHPQQGKRILASPLIEELEAVHKPDGTLIGYKRPTQHIE